MGVEGQTAQFSRKSTSRKRPIWAFVLLAVSLMTADALSKEGPQLSKDELRAILKVARPEAKAMFKCYRSNVTRYAMESCEAAQVVVDAAYGACWREEKAYINTVAKLGGSNLVDEGKDTILWFKREWRPRYLAGILELRVTAGLCRQTLQ